MTVTQYDEEKKELAKKLGDLDAICVNENREPTVEERELGLFYIKRMDECDAQISFIMAKEKRMEEMKKPAPAITRVNVEEQEERKAPRIEFPRKQDRFNSFGEQLQAIMKAGTPGGHVDPRLSVRAASGLQEGVASDGGFLIQTDFSNEILRNIWETAPVVSRVRRIGISGNSTGIKIPGIAETSRVAGSRWGGIRGYWAGEADEKTKSKPAFRQIELSLKKLVGLCYATDEMLSDATALEGIIRQGFRSEFDFMLTDSIINGTGAGTPLGILNSPCLVSQAKEAGQLADTVVAENIIKMYARLFAASRPSAVWLINQDVEPQLHTMSIGVGTGGVPVFMPAGGISGAPYGTLFGRPVIAIEQCPTVGDVGDVLLCDLGQYIMIDKGGIEEAMSIHVRFVYDESVFRFVYRCDGQPALNSAITPFKGSATQSAFVAIAARA